MEVICEKYHKCILQHDQDFVCGHSKPHEKLSGTQCNENGCCSECNTIALRKIKLEKLNESSL